MVELKRYRFHIYIGFSTTACMEVYAFNSAAAVRVVERENPGITDWNFLMFPSGDYHEVVN